MDIIPGGGGCYAQVPYRTGRGRMEIGLQQSGCVYEKVEQEKEEEEALILFDIIII